MDADRLAACTCRWSSSTPTPASAASATSTPTWCARRCPRCRSTTSTCWSSRTSATSSARPSSASARTPAIMVTSVTEGEEKPLKYPLMFRACELVLINKVDLLPHLDFDVEKLLYNIDAVNPDARTLLVSAKTGEGIDEWRAWLQRARGAGRSPTHEQRARHRRRPRRAHAAATRRSSPPRPSASPACATGWPSASRAAAGWSPSAGDARRALRRPPRGGRVRPSGDRRQAGAAGDRRDRRGRRRSPTRRRWSSRPATSRSPSAPTRTAARRPRRWPSRASAAR